MTDTTIPTPTLDSPVQLSAPLVQEGQALESSRDAGYDLAAAVGEPVDNSIQAGARIIRIRTTTATEGKTKRISEIAFADDGLGIAPETLASALSLGFGTRINDRSGLGRFGMGLKLATLSQARRCDIWSRQAGSDAVFHTFLDLDQIQAGAQTELTATQVDGFPTDWQDLMSDPRKSRPFSSGTLVVWSNIDRLTGGGRFGAAIDERLSELLYFLKRAYRRFIDEGLYIELDGKEVHLHDPLFLLDMPRVVERFDNAKADILGDEPIEIDGHKVHVRVTLLPEVFRRVRGVGGHRGDEGKQFADLYIPDNEGKVSILREGREIYYDIVPKLLPGGTRESTASSVSRSAFPPPSMSTSACATSSVAPNPTASSAARSASSSSGPSRSRAIASRRTSRRTISWSARTRLSTRPLTRRSSAPPGSCHRVVRVRQIRPEPSPAAHAELAKPVAKALLPLTKQPPRAVRMT